MVAQPKPPLTVLDIGFSIHRTAPGVPVPSAVSDSPFYWIGRTDEETSIVCASHIEIPHAVTNRGWSCLKVAGPVDFSVTGLLAEISAALAAAKISLFAVSTFDTDYILIPSSRIDDAKRALRQSDFDI